MEPLKLENQLRFPLYAAAWEVVKKYTPLLREVNLTYTQYITMIVLWEKRYIGVKPEDVKKDGDGLFTMRELGRNTGIEPPKQEAKVFTNFIRE
ncbi:MAG: hypothetical protein LBD79_02995 [Treponema sp.]|jgi:hypothetical protein|nr:hypothetical protein [Treponema sp.]